MYEIVVLLFMLRAMIDVCGEMKLLFTTKKNLNMQDTSISFMKLSGHQLQGEKVVDS